MSKNNQPHNDSSVNPANSVVQAAAADPLLDAASAEVVSPLASEGAAVGAAASSPSDASVSQPAGGARASEAEEDPFPPVTGTALETEDRALLRAENERLRRLAEALSREWLRERDWHDSTTSRYFPWVDRAFKLDWRDVMKHSSQVRCELAELKRKQLERKQSQDKEN